MTAALIKISFGVFHAVECGNLSSAADRSDGSVTERRERVDTDGRLASRRYSPTRSNTYSQFTSCLTLRRTPVSCMSERNEQYPLIYGVSNLMFFNWTQCDTVQIQLPTQSFTSTEMSNHETSIIILQVLKTL